MVSNNVDVSIVLPVFNEEKNISRVVKEFSKIAKVINLEVIFVEDGGSKDKTRLKILDYSKKYPFVRAVFIKEKGYGISIYRGLKIAKGKFIGWTHSDLQTPPADVLRAYYLINKQPNYKKYFVKGKRYGRPITDKLINTLGMSLFESLILGKVMYDINAQPNLFHRSFLDCLKNPPADFAFDLYVYFIAKKNKYSILRLPVYFGKRIYGESAWNSGWKSRIKFINRTISFTLKLRKMLR